MFCRQEINAPKTQLTGKIVELQIKQYIKISGTKLSDYGLMLIGSDDVLPLCGHLGNSERVVKPALIWAGFIYFPARIVDNAEPIEHRG